MRNLKCITAALFASLAVTSPALAEDLVFTLNNNTSAVMVRFHTSPVDVESWEDDVLGSDVLGPGESIEITIADGRDVCRYDMKFEFEPGTLETLTDTQDLCELGSYTINE